MEKADRTTLDPADSTLLSLGGSASRLRVPAPTRPPDLLPPAALAWAQAATMPAGDAHDRPRHARTVTSSTCPRPAATCRRPAFALAGWPFSLVGTRAGRRRGLGCRPHSR